MCVGTCRGQVGTRTVGKGRHVERAERPEWSAAWVGTVCTTGSATTATLTAAVSDAYYLVVPRNQSMEGSYGSDGAGLERPPAGDACLAQVLDPICP